ncbi:arylsulfatase [Sphingobacterium psychroaquaticum]|uniref:Arylsulfatase A n=1 Tax=Sphingobacterium psychroaquaticum TaxID=561061 RepID=A0A1X7J1H5_9SPHI|nr:arylsulfatase [Sphingobacterium psychroaquaticum]SMG21077.1 Arylsulfatase A [Sphingobacterium psychroaquaticum]
MYQIFKKIALLLLVLLGAINLVAQPHKKPNIIYIYADDMGYGELGAYGQKLIQTPHLDQMANEGIRFTQHYTSTPVCAPARAMLLTGKHGGHSYIRGNYEMGGFPDDKEGGQMPLPEGIFTLPKMLKEHGYTTGIVGKWGLGMHFTTGDPQKQGFDYAYGYLDQKQAHNYYPTHLWENGKWDSLANPYVFVHQQVKPEAAVDAVFDTFSGKEYAPEKMTGKALNFIARNKEHPFFLYLPYTIPHVALQAPKSYVEKYIGKFPGEKPYLGNQGYNPSKYPLSTYAAMITYLDDQVGLILAKLKELGLDDNTIVLFSSDNGSTFNGGVNLGYFNLTGGLRGTKTEVYEGGIRVPFIARWPKQIPQGVVSDFVSVQYDMMATFADILNIRDIKTDGVSILPVLLGQSDRPQRPYIYFEYPENGGQIAIRMGRWKGVKVDVRARGYVNSPWQIYDLETDPKESQDRFLEQTVLARQFDEIVRREHQHAHIKEWEFINPKF